MSIAPETTEQTPLELLDPPEQVLRRSFDEAALVELEQSMATNGQIQPIAVRRYEQGPRRQIMVGHRRSIVAARLGWRSLRSEVYPPHTKTLDLAIAENEHRADLSPLEQAALIVQMLDAGDSIGRVASRWKRSEVWVASRRALLGYPGDVQRAVEQDQMPLSVARLLAEVDHDSYRQRLIDDWKRHGATATTVGVWLQHYAGDRARIQSNENTVDEIIVRRDAYQVICPCEYCGAPEPLQDTRIWRLCSGCTRSLLELVREGRTNPATPSP